LRLFPLCLAKTRVKVATGGGFISRWMKFCCPDLVAPSCKLNSTGYLVGLRIHSATYVAFAVAAAKSLVTWESPEMTPDEANSFWARSKVENHVFLGAQFCLLYCQSLVVVAAVETVTKKIKNKRVSFRCATISPPQPPHPLWTPLL